MMHLLHRTMPIIALAALVTVSPVGAQERDDSTSTASSVGALLGLGARFMTSRSGADDVSSPSDWNCAGGCRAFRARSLGAAPIGRAMPRSSRSESRWDAAAFERLRRERADLSDYGWTRRVDTDGSSTRPVNATPLFSTTEESVEESPSKAVERPTASDSRQQPDGFSQTSAWAASGRGAADLNSPTSESPDWKNEENDNTGGNAAGAVGQGSRAVTSSPAVASFAESFDQVAPLVTTVPEPSSVALLAVGLSSLLFARRRSIRCR